MKFLILISVLTISSIGHAQSRSDMRPYVLEAIDYLSEHYGYQGYSHGTYFTHDLDYSTEREIKAGKSHPKTMCVAAVAEVIITAIHMYAEKTGDTSVFTKLPARSWSRSASYDLRPYIFMYDKAGSDGTGDALAHFGLGDNLPFSELKAGDFINFNRTNKTGHAVVFMGYIDAKGDLLASYDPAKVVGFKYFSAQGARATIGVKGGLGFRWAYFDKHCPAKNNKYRPRDCGVIESTNPRVFNSGFLFSPEAWRSADDHKNRLIETKARELAGVDRSDTKRPAPAPKAEHRARAKVAIETELDEHVNDAYTGTTTDE